MRSKQRVVLWSLSASALVALALWGLLLRPAPSAEAPLEAASQPAVDRADAAAARAPGSPLDAEQRAAEREALLEPALPASGLLWMRAVDARSREPLVGATLQAYGAQREVTLLAASNSDGRMSVERARVEGLDVLCRMEGYAAERVAAPASELPDELVIELVRTVALQGRIIVPRDGSLPHGLFVLAWPESETGPWNLTLPELLAHPQCLAAQTGEGGEFSLHGRPDTVYSVVAGGKGWAGYDTPTSGRPGGQPIEIMVHRLYGAALRLRSEGAPLRLHRSFGGRNYGTPKLPEDFRRASPVFGGSPAVGLNAAAQQAIEDLRSDPWTRLSMFRLPVPEVAPIPDAIAGLSLDLELPGYRAAQVVFDCTRLDFPLDVITVELEASGTGFGGLTLGFEPRLAHALLGANGARLILDEIGTELEFFLNARGADRSEASVSWQGVPAGEYRATFAPTHSLGSFAVTTRGGDEAISITPGVTTRVVIAERELGLVVLDPRLEGRPYSGTLSVSWRETEVDPRRVQWQHRTFTGPPYHFGSPAGQHELKVKQPFHRREDPPGAIIELEPRGTVVVELELARRSDI